MEQPKYHPNDIQDPELKKFVEESRKRTEALGIPETPEPDSQTSPSGEDISERMQTVRKNMEAVRRNMMEGGLVDNHTAASIEQEIERKRKDKLDKLEDL